MSAAGAHSISCLDTSKAEAGYRMLIDVILLRVVLTVHCQAQNVDIISDIPVEATFETGSGERSFSRMIDVFLMEHRLVN
jgi:hypothetical protein